MLTDKQIELVKATVPVLKEHGVALTTYFYKRMLAGNPELKNVFNQSHQVGLNQPKALAGAVLAYAQNIDNLGALAGAVKHIANKHATIDIRPEQYDIVGKHLLASIKEVLGDAATDDLIDAWAAAYGQLAQILIGAEADIYKQQSNTEGSWAGWRPFKVTSRVQETPKVVSFTLAPADQGKVPTFVPGQYLSVRAFLPSLGLMQPRQYTVTSEPGASTLRITVKQIEGTEETPAGAMSNYLHSSLKEGDVIEVSAPLGEFTLKDGTNQVVFISAGIGITPMAAMLKKLAAETPDRPVVFAYGTQTAEDFPLQQEVREALGKLQNRQCGVFLSKAGADGCCCKCMQAGRLDAQALQKFKIDSDADVYVCGPEGFMRDLMSAASSLGLPASQIHAEVFGTGSPN